MKKIGVRRGVKKVDKIVTGLIIGGALASVLGISQSKKGKKFTHRLVDKLKCTFQKSYSALGKSVVGIVNFFKKK